MSSLAQMEANAKYATSGLQSAIDGTIDIQLWFDVEDERKATERVDMTTVTRLSFDESMFSVLPSMTIDMVDDGTYYNLRPMRIGRKVYVRIQSKAKTDSGKDVEPLRTRMCIVSIKHRIDQASGRSEMSIQCEYDCLALIDSIPTYPPPGLSVTTVIPDDSSTTVTKVCAQVGLSCLSDLTGLTDTMTYVNGSLTAKKFLDKIVAHAWVGEDDAPVFYVDLEGNAHFTSIATMAKDPNKLDFIGQAKFNLQIQRTEHTELYDTFLLPTHKLIYQDIQQVNLGSTLGNRGAGRTRAAMFDPTGTTSLALTGLSSKASFPDVRNTSLTETADTGYVAYDATAGRDYLCVTPNVDSSRLEAHTVTEHAGIVSTSTHALYDAAYANNRSVKLSFFQDFWKVTMDMNKQPMYFYRLAGLFPRIGRVAHVDFTNEDFDNRVLTGDYLITRVQHVWVPGNTYSVGLTLVAGGDYASQ